MDGLRLPSWMNGLDNWQELNQDSRCCCQLIPSSNVSDPVRGDAVSAGFTLNWLPGDG